MKRFSIVLFSLLLLTASAQAQVDPERLAKLPNAWHEKIAKVLPGWSVRAIEPIEGSKNVVIEQWEAGDVAIKIAVTEYELHEEAVRALSEFRSQLRTQEDAAIANGKSHLKVIKEDLPVLGEGGFVWDIRGAEAAVFRKGHFLVVVSMARPAGYNDVSLSRVFAAHVAAALPAR